MTNPYDSPQGIENPAPAGGAWFPWPRVRPMLRPLFHLLFVVAIIIFLVMFVGGRIGSVREELRRTRADSIERLRPSPPDGLTGNQSSNRP